MSVTSTMVRVPGALATRMKKDPNLIDETVDADEVDDIDLPRIVFFFGAGGLIEVADILQEPDPVDADSGMELIIFGRKAVKTLAALTSSFDLERVTATVRAAKNYEYFTSDPSNVDRIARQVRRVVPFWSKAAQAGEAVVVTSI